MIDANDAIDELTLMLMYLTSWRERKFPGRYAWKGYDFDVINDLDDKGLIGGSRRSKSVAFTEEGERRAVELLAKYGIERPDE